ncbi:thioredoxin family protein [Cellulomonas marina]|uniref:Thioredoxin domain-containing protein n=1 Tax=Cellulomonas marina TaxID=988821 RepID=A0A1I1A862_9CELL|nr:thioredoxin family protein [Cellulomonas marina]GIG29605.1 hypothetical protein Cma02nite_22050 [Cellulomonas marina]SFB33722.1 hypothetical protein SAMN05421867_11575 [Cellulomonas marina]
MTGDPLVGLAVVVAVLALATVAGVVRARRSGRVRAVVGADALAAHEVGGLGRRATVVQFSSVACSPCRATRVLLAPLDDEDVRVVELDAEEHLALTRRLSVLRTPTVLVLDAAGRVVHRVSGVPRLPELRAGLDALRVAA